MTDEANPASLCAYGSIYVNTGKPYCNKVSYDGMKVDGTTKLVSCDIGTEKACKYKNFDNSTYPEECSCGYNKDGKSYCPVAKGCK
jgi:hypothetical protein